MSQKQVMLKSEDLSRSLEINAIWTFDTEFPTIFNKPCTYITFKSAVKHRQLGYGYPREQIVHLAEATTQDTYSYILARKISTASLPLSVWLTKNHTFILSRWITCINPIYYFYNIFQVKVTNSFNIPMSISVSKY